MTKKIVVLTGASRGIGREAALLLAAAGCDLVLAARTRAALDEVAQACKVHGVQATAVVCDLGDRSACENLILRARELGAGMYPVLINNAGSATFGSFVAMASSALDEQVTVNYWAPMRLCHLAMPWMLEGGGQIVNVLSIAAKHPFPGSAAYCSSKAALLMMGRSLAAEYRASGLRVTSLIPGSTDTPFWEAMEWKPECAQMLPTTAVAEAIRDVVMSPLDRNYDEVVIMPPLGIL